jgi:hypothetical protein
MQAVMAPLAAAVHAPGDEKQHYTLSSKLTSTSTTSSGARMITLRFDDIVEKLKQMEEQESGEAWVDDEEQWEKEKRLGKSPKRKHAARADGAKIDSPVADAKLQRLQLQPLDAATSIGDEEEDDDAYEDEDEDEDCEPGLTPRPGEGSQIDDPALARARKRMNVLVEIFETEKDYYRDLEILNNVRCPCLLEIEAATRTLSIDAATRELLTRCMQHINSCTCSL